MNLEEMTPDERGAVVVKEIPRILERLKPLLADEAQRYPGWARKDLEDHLAKPLTVGQLERIAVLALTRLAQKEAES